MTGIRKNVRCDFKIVKIYSSYFFKEQTDQEYKQWRQTKTGVIYDVTND